MSTFFITINVSIYLSIYLSIYDFRRNSCNSYSRFVMIVRSYTKILTTDMQLQWVFRCIFAHMPFHENRKAYSLCVCVYVCSICVRVSMEVYIVVRVYLRIDIWVAWMTYTKPRNNSHKYPVKCLRLFEVKKRKTIIWRKTR